MLSQRPKPSQSLLSAFIRVFALTSLVQLPLVTRGRKRRNYKFKPQWKRRNFVNRDNFVFGKLVDFIMRRKQNLGVQWHLKLSIRQNLLARPRQLARQVAQTLYYSEQVTFSLTELTHNFRVNYQKRQEHLQLFLQLDLLLRDKQTERKQ